MARMQSKWSEQTASMDRLSDCAYGNKWRNTLKVRMAAFDQVRKSFAWIKLKLLVDVYSHPCSLVGKFSSPLLIEMLPPGVGTCSVNFG